MSQLLPLRGFNRSQRVGIAGKDLSSARTTWLNIDNKRVQRDLARHGTLGSIYPVGSAIFQDDKGTVEVGGSVTVQATGRVVNVSAASGQKTDGTNWSSAAGTATVTANASGQPRIDAIVVNVNTGALTVNAGTGTAGAQLGVPAQTGFLSGRGTPGANEVTLALVLVPNGAANLNQSDVLDVRP